jgi:hypothetical protein
MHTYRNGTCNSTFPRQISGLQIATQPRSTRERAELAAAIGLGETKLVGLTYAQIAAICGVSAPYVCRVRLARACAELRRYQLARAAAEAAVEPAVAPVIQLAAE